jgi:hypothetical protein
VFTDIPIEKRFAVLVEICRASHFAWREAVLRRCPDVDVRAVVNEMWDITGVQTAEAYLRHLDPSKDLTEQIAASVAWSSQCMGEEARLEAGSDSGEFFVRHDSCPWHRWHEKRGLLAEDRPGCDRWFDAMIRTINEKLGVKLRFETLSALPEGGDYCLRRFWQDDTGPD